MASGPGEQARLLALTREEILARGVIGLSLSELARSIGSNNRMLLYHFGSLDELLVAAADEIIGGSALVDRLSALLGSPGSALDRLSAAWRHIADPARLPHLRLFFARFGVAVDRPERDGDLLDQVRARWTAVAAVGSSGQSRGLADTELKRRIPGKWPTGPVPEALDEPKAAERDEQRQFLREDAPDFERCDDEVGIGVSRQVPRPARDLRGRIVDLSDIDANIATVRIHERQGLPGAPHAIGFGKQAHARVEDIEDKPSSGRQVLSNRPEAAHQVLGLMQMQQRIGCDEYEVERAA